MTKYFRTRGGAVIHLSTCRYAVDGPHAAPWYWADAAPDWMVAVTASSHGYKACGVCKPFGGA